MELNLKENLEMIRSFKELRTIQMEINISESSKEMRETVMGYTIMPQGTNMMGNGKQD